MLIDILLVLLGVVIGGIIGFFTTKKYMESYLKKNPPINEQMIKAMYSSMGRTPSQKQINQTMNAMKKNL
ncbi:MAG: YneF family protein [Bacilli bacterium]